MLRTVVVVAALLPGATALLLPGVRHASAVQRCTAPRACDGLPDFVVELEEPMLDEEITAPAAPDPPAPSMAGSSISVVPDGEWIIGEDNGVHSLQVGVAGKTMHFESGLMAKLSSGAVSLQVGETNVFCAATFERKADPTPIDFTPLRVDFFERSSSVGRTKGGYIKRDGRPSAHETLVSRLIDRPIRPLVPPGWSLETQLTAYVLSYDGEHIPDVMGVTAASASLMLSEVPFDKPVACVRVGLVPPAEGEEGPGTFVVNPTKEQAAASSFDLVLAGTAEAVLMIEGFADFLPEETVLEGLELGFAAVRTIALALTDWAGAVGKPKWTAGIREKPPAIRDEFARLKVTEQLKVALCGFGGVEGAKDTLKPEREAAVSAVQKAVIAQLTGGGKEPRLGDETIIEGLLEKAGGATEEEAAAAAAAAAPAAPAVAQYDIADVRSELKHAACVALREVVADT